MTFDEARRVVSRITYKPNWMIGFEAAHDDVWHLWANLETIDALDGKPISLSCRIWLITPDFTPDEIIRTALLMFREAEEHELLEFFRVDGISLFNPHTAIEDVIAAQTGP